MVENKPCISCTSKDMRLVAQDLLIRRLIAHNKKLIEDVTGLRGSIDSFVLNTKVNELTSIVQ